MPNEVNDRLVSLYEKITPSLSNSDLAFLSAVSKGVDTVKAWLEYILREQFADSMTDDGLYNYCKLLGVDLELDDNDKRAAVVSALKIKKGDYERGELEACLKSINQKLHAFIYRFVMKISGFNISRIADLPRITETVDLYLLPGVIPVFANDGLAFSQWDNLDKSFKELEDLNCPFSMLDTI